jgi:hypothetical protein
MTAAAAATKSFHLELLRKLKKSENLNNISFHRIEANNNSKMEQLFDCSSTNSSCSSSSNAHTPTRDTLKANETQVKSANSVTFKTKTNNNIKSAIVSNTPSATATKQLNRTNTVSAASIRYSKILLIIIITLFK